MQKKYTATTVRRRQGGARGNPKLRSSARVGVNVEASAVDQPLEDPGDISVTNSEVKSVMNHRQRKESLRHIAFSDQEFSVFNLIDAYLRAAQTGLEGIANLLSTNMQVEIGSKTEHKS